MGYLFNLGYSISLQVKTRKAATTLEMEAAKNPTLESIQPDPTLFCTGFNKNRFYLFSRYICRKDDTIIFVVVVSFLLCFSWCMVLNVKGYLQDHRTLFTRKYTDSSTYNEIRTKNTRIRAHNMKYEWKIQWETVNNRKEVRKWNFFGAFILSLKSM